MAITDDSSENRGLPKLPDLAGLSDDEKTEPNNVLPDSDIKIKRGAPRMDVPEDLPLSGRLTKREPPPAVDDKLEIPPDDTHFDRTFVGYQLEEKIGQGGMGMVYKGRQVSLDRQVAIKILNKSLCDNVEFIKRFEREAKSIARITHPNIVAVYDFGKTDGLWYMVTEYVEGSNLARLIAERLVLQVDEVLPLVTQCLAGLAHVSQSGIVHRDVKPDNILITKDNIAKIADFGLAKDVTSDTDLTAVGLAMGTPSYMSPEQCMGRRLDVRSDIYSLGVTAYYALTGEKPFTGQSSFEIMTKQREYMPPPPFQLNPRLPKDVSNMIMRMIAKSPGDRFTDAEECRQAWLDLGGRLGVLQVTRSGEFRFPSPNEMMNKSTATAHEPLPSSAAPAPLPLSMPSAPPLSVSAAASLAQEPVTTPMPAMSGARPPTESRIGEAAPKQNAERARGTTERRATRNQGAAEAMTCARCGMLNRAEVSSCQRCGAVMHDTEQLPAKEQEAKADHFFEQANYREAATLYARLADKVQDRKQRSILRSKEREARKLEQEGQLNEINNRSTMMIERGDLRASLELLERGLQNVRDSGASNSGAESQLLHAITSLRYRMRRRRRMRFAAVLIIIGLLAASLIAGWAILRRSQTGGGKSAAPKSESAPAAAETEAP